MDTPVMDPQQAKSVLRASLAGLAALTTQVLQRLALSFEKTGEVEVSQLLALGKQIVEAGRELNRMDACEQRATATALRREQFEAKNAREAELHAQTLQQMRQSTQGPRNSPPGGSAGERIFSAAREYASVIAAARSNGQTDLPEMPPALQQALQAAGVDPRDEAVQQDLLEKMVGSGMLPGITLPTMAQG
ncbi:MAG: hypothetical protein IPP14_10960 [Planctomycetes bacterium]|nr:hypothetical protein [Planctomycetota bacterium]